MLVGVNKIIFAIKLCAKSIIHHSQSAWRFCSSHTCVAFVEDSLTFSFIKSHCWGEKKSLTRLIIHENISLFGLSDLSKVCMNSCLKVDQSLTLQRACTQINNPSLSGSTNESNFSRINWFWCEILWQTWREHSHHSQLEAGLLTQTRAFLLWAYASQRFGCKIKKSHS